MSVYDDRKYKYISNLAKKRKYNDALIEVKRYIDEFPNDNKGKYLYAYVIEGMGNIKRAAEIYKSLIKLDDNIKYNCLYRLGMMDLTANHIDEAKKKFYKVINESPYNEASSYMALIEIELANNNLDSAMEIVNQFSGKDDRITISKAQIYLEQQKFELTLNTLDDIIDKKEQDTSRKIDIIKGKIALEKGDYYTAKELFEHSLIGTRNARFYSNKLELARLEKKFLKYDEAIELCDEVINNEKKHMAKANLLKGDCYLGKGDYDTAEYLYKIVLENFKEKKNNAYFKLGFLMFIKRKYNDAVKYFFYVNKDSKEYEKSLYYIVLSYIRLKKYKKAEKYVDQLQDNSRLKLIIDKDSGRRIIPKGYIEKQLLHYSIDEAIKHAKRIHRYDGEENTFNTDIVIEDLFLKVKDKLTSDKLISCDLFDQYLIPYENCGYSGKNIANAIVVVVEPITKHIMTMYPVYSVKIAEDNYKPTSRIDKFYKKYGLKK